MRVTGAKRDDLQTAMAADPQGDRPTSRCPSTTSATSVIGGHAGACTRPRLTATRLRFGTARRSSPACSAWRPPALPHRRCRSVAASAARRCCVIDGKAQQRRRRQQRSTACDLVSVAGGEAVVEVRRQESRRCSSAVHQVNLGGKESSSGTGTPHRVKRRRAAATSSPRRHDQRQERCASSSTPARPPSRWAQAEADRTSDSTTRSGQRSATCNTANGDGRCLPRAR